MSFAEQIFYLVPAVLLAISVHEFSHGYVAHCLGDPTPEQTGRLTLNPLAHLDPIGAIMLLVFRFGWAKPVLVNPAYFKNPRRGMLYVGIAGPVANVLTAWILVLLMKLVVFVFRDLNLSPGVFYWITNFFTFINISVGLNLWLASFNLIPIPPLDGSKILLGILPRRYVPFLVQLEQYGWIILILLVVSGQVSTILEPIYLLLHRVITFI